MDTALLQRWLNLPTGAWPPEPMALLGYPNTPADAEIAALARMELLRPHQLLHPELVTEGMNRLAQALLHFGASTDIRDEPRNPNVNPAPLEVRRPKLKVKRLRKRTKVEPLIPLEHEQPQALPQGLEVVPSERRKAYRELVQLRKLRELWTNYGPFLGKPLETLVNAESVYILLNNKCELEKLLMNHPVGDKVLRPEFDMLLNLMMCHNPASTIADLVPSQRQRVAQLWKAAGVKIDLCTEALRDRMRDTVPRHPWLKHWRGWILAFRQTPEWILFVLAGLVILVAVVRWASAPSAGQSPITQINQQPR